MNIPTPQAPAGSDAISERDTLAREVARRRTFAIISHPDAGKTTLTEKLLLYAGAIELAGAVRGRKTQRHAMSDWMEMEQQRGISISAAALEFELEGPSRHAARHAGPPGLQRRHLPHAARRRQRRDGARRRQGHRAADAASCSRCAGRAGLPVLTFINKLDQPSLDPFELIDEIERVLGIAAAPMNWPLGDGVDFRGVYDLETNALLALRARRARHADRAGRGRPIPRDRRVGEMVGDGASARS